MTTKNWGNAVWYLFHTLAEKINDDYFKENKDKIISLIYLICSNLPCPYCKEHALTTLKQAKLNNLTSKEELKYFFWSFHNIVNQQLNKNKYEYKDLDKYKKAITINIINNFKNNFYKRGYNIKLIADNFNLNNSKIQINNIIDNCLFN